MALTSQSETPLSGENYNKLAESLDKDVDDFMGKLEKKPYTDGFTEDNWEQVLY